MKRFQVFKYWSKKETLLLLQGVGANGLAWIKRRTGNRSKWSIYDKLKQLTGNGGLTRGSFTLSAACRHTGYAAHHLKRARDALHQKWKKTSRKGSYFITEEQLEELTDWLALGYWSNKHHLYKCVWCYKNDYQHVSYGLCEKCFSIFESKLRKLGLKRGIKYIEIYLNSIYSGEIMDSLNKKLGRGLMVPMKYLEKKCVMRK